ncbi:MAG: penicillin-binding transpeptidase domain-containing protein [Bacillota bacterium]|nr:penicillin-binding transpeptidase domain-containing protein [Bacillota bacterium]
MKANKKIIILLVTVSALFLSLIVYLTLFGLFKAPEIEKSVYNQRSFKREESILRGTIYDRNGEILATSEVGKEGQKRVYPYGSLYTHLIGYSSRTYGKSKLEQSFDKYLSGKDDVSTALTVVDAVSGKQKTGMDLYLTVDHKLQKYASDLLGNKNGAIIVMDPDTGAIRAMVSNPTFNPDADWLSKNWTSLTESNDSPFVARATSGLYAPGSTWKIVTACAAIEAGMENEKFKDEGKVIIGGKEYTNSKKRAYGKITLDQAFLHSSNVVFASIGDKLGQNGMKIYDRFLLGQKINFDIPVTVSGLSGGSMSETDIASTAIGQGKLGVTPLYMLLVAASIENGGKIMQPYVVGEASRNNITGYKCQPGTIATAVDAATAKKVKDMMKLCVQKGTGTSARVSGLDVYGKTGTAQNETDKSHDWFAGFAEAPDGNKAAICVMLEYNGQGSSSSASIAGKVLSHCLK